MKNDISKVYNIVDGPDYCSCHRGVARKIKSTRREPRSVSKLEIRQAKINKVQSSVKINLAVP